MAGTGEDRAEISDIWSRSASWRAIYFESLDRGLSLSEAFRRVNGAEKKCAAPRPAPPSTPGSERA